MASSKENLKQRTKYFNGTREDLFNCILFKNEIIYCSLF